jgi:hypothetical protein
MKRDLHHIPKRCLINLTSKVLKVFKSFLRIWLVIFKIFLFKNILKYFFIFKILFLMLVYPNNQNTHKKIILKKN